MTSLALMAAPTLDQKVGQAISDARAFSVHSGDKVWPGYGQAPWGFLLVSGEVEQLVCQPAMPPGFTPVLADASTDCVRYVRPRSSLPDNLLAAMPVFGSPSTIVMGTPSTTGRSWANWTRTILHEHFHQWQDALPGYFAQLAHLDLAGGDQSGMWMLNYPFPYAKPQVTVAFGRAARALGSAQDARGTPEFRSKFRAYLRARNGMAAIAGERNWRYAELELWREGVARWTEIKLGGLFPDASVQASARDLERTTREYLKKPDLAASGREFVYPYGAAEAMLLDACGSDWKREYPKQLGLRLLLHRAINKCRPQQGSRPASREHVLSETTNF